MITVHRRDAVSIKDLKLTPEGYLQAPALVAKVGILKYWRDGKEFREFVPAATLFEAESMATLPGQPFTNRHPAIGNVDSKNAATVMRGFTLPPVEKVTDGEDELLGCSVKVVDEATIADIRSGVQELSLGYEAQLDMTPGTWRGEHYDAVQTRRRYNHLAAVEAARAGHKARLRLDAAHNVIEEEGMELVTIKIDGKDVQVPAESKTAIEAALAKGVRADGEDLTAKLAETQRKADALAGELEALKKADADRGSEKAKAEEKARLDAMVKELVTLTETAKGLLPVADHAKLDGLDAQGIKALVLNTLDPELKLDGKSAEYVSAYFDSACKAKAVKQEVRKDGLGSLIVYGQKHPAKAEGGRIVLNQDQAIELGRRNLSEGWRKPISV